jgi:hypothetical protein
VELGQGEEGCRQLAVEDRGPVTIRHPPPTSIINAPVNVEAAPTRNNEIVRLLMTTGYTLTDENIQIQTAALSENIARLSFISWMSEKRYRKLREIQSLRKRTDNDGYRDHKIQWLKREIEILDGEINGEFGIYGVQSKVYEDAKW